MMALHPQRCGCPCTTADFLHQRTEDREPVHCGAVGVLWVPLDPDDPAVRMLHRFYDAVDSPGRHDKAVAEAVHGLMMAVADDDVGPAEDLTESATVLDGHVVVEEQRLSWPTVVRCVGSEIGDEGATEVHVDHLRTPTDPENG